MTAISCNKEIETPDVGTDVACPEGYYVEELTAVYPRDPETRTAFNETTGRFAWTEGDQLAFHLSNGEYVAAPIDPATGKVKLYLPVGVTRDNYAVYPASAIVDEAAAIGNMKVTLPDTYDISANPNTDFVPTPLVAWNDAENTHLKFEHVGGLLQVNLTVPAGVKTAKLNMGKTITGTFSLEDGTGNGIIVPGAESTEGLTFVLSDSESGLAEPTAVKLLAPLPAGSYEHFEIDYDNGFEFSKDLSANPWTFTRSGGKKVSISEDKFEDPRDFVVLEALQDNCEVCLFGRTVNALYYSLDKVHWSVVHWENTEHLSSVRVPLPKAGDKLWIYGVGNDNFGQGYLAGASAYPTDNNGHNNIYFSNASKGRLKISGNLLALLDAYNPVMTTDFCFMRAFYQSTAIVDASELILPDYTTKYCYESMFTSSKLEIPPVLPSLQLSKGCYSNMFNSCKLQNTPVLPATVMEERCYEHMFDNCKTVTIPTEMHAVVPATECFQFMYSYSGVVDASSLVLPETVAYGFCGYMFSGCESLKVGPTFTALDLSAGTQCYYHMFQSCSGLETAPVLPATTLSANCYSDMFNRCTSLVNAPELPAMNLAKNCYTAMFGSCTSLVQAPALPATTLAESCYYGTFSSCTSLTEAPVLPATTLKKGCYTSMFRECSSLERAPELPAKTLVANCYNYMFYGCSSLNYIKANFTTKPTTSNCSSWVANVSSTGEFVKNPAATWAVTGVNGVPAGWTVTTSN